MREAVKYILVILLVVKVFTNAYAGESIMLNVYSDTNVIRIGEQFNLTLEVKYPEKASVLAPAFDKALGEGIELVDVFPPDSGNIEDGMRSFLQKFKLTSFDTGFHMIPPMPFTLNFKGITDTLYSNPIPLFVMSVPLDTTNNIFDIKPQYPVKFKLTEIARGWLLYTYIALLIISLTILYFERKNKNKIVEKKVYKPKEPAHVIALRELDELKKEKLWQQNLIKEYYTRLTEIIRRYIELRYNVNALEQTSSEIIASFRSNRLITEELTEHLTELLSLADIIKFAKGTAQPVENEQNMERVYDFVYKTKPEMIINTKENSENKAEDIVEPEEDLKNE